MPRLAAVALALVLPAGAAAALAAGSKSDSVRDNFYRPGKLTISRGQTVVWTWHGAAQHSVTDTKHRFGSKIQTTGTYKHKFRAAGTYVIYCRRHPEIMRMKVIVR